MTNKAGFGALFFKADADTGEIVGVSGVFTPIEGMKLLLSGPAPANGVVTLVGTVDGMKASSVIGWLAVDTKIDDPAKYMRGEIVVSGRKKSVTYKINSKNVLDKQGEPYRMVWLANNTVRAAY